MDPENKSKREFLLKLLAEGDAMVCLDARHEGVDVPRQHRDNPMLNLVFNLGFRRPFQVEEEGIYATLAFGGRPHKCILPFEAVWAIYVPETQNGQVWESSIPEDLDLSAAGVTGQPGENAPGSAQKPAPQPKPGLKTKPGGKPESEEKPKRDRSHLRVIK